MKQLCIYFLVGFTVPFNLYSQHRWFKTFGSNDSDWGSAVAAGKEGHYYLGISTPYNPPQNSRINGGVVKTDVTGELVWKKEFIGPDNIYMGKIVPLDDGILVACSEGNSLSGGTGVLLVRMDFDGNILWHKKYHVTANDVLADVAEVPGEGFVIAGVLENNISGEDTWVFKTDYQGNVLWSTAWENPVELIPHSISLTPSGNIVVAGTARIFQPFSYAFMLMLQPDGTEIWRRSGGTTYDDEPAEVMTDATGNIWMAGTSYFLNREMDGWIWKINADGSFSDNWSYNGGSAYGEFFRCARMEPDGIVIGGDIGGFEDRDIFLLKVDTAGQFIFSGKYPVNSQFTNYMLDVDVVPGDGYICTGDIRPVTTYREPMIIKTDSEGFVDCYFQPLSLDIHKDTVTWTGLQMTKITASVVTEEIMLTEFTSDFARKTHCEYIVPEAAIDTSFPQVVCPQTCFAFSDSSQYMPLSWQWTFEAGSPASSDEKNPGQVCFPGDGEYRVTLVVSNEFASDSTEMIVKIAAGCPVQIPNVFTPNGDGLNETFQLTGLPQEFYFTIYNRWGMQVFDTSDPAVMWNGKLDNSGNDLPEGVYHYVFYNHTSPSVQNGFLHLVR